MRARLLALAIGAAATSARGQTVYPSAAEVPANLLRVSVVFAAPPPAGLTPRMWLSDPAGREIAGAFYPQRLWSPDGRTLTLYLDPGRVKTGLILRDERGPILLAGQRVELRMGDRALKTWLVDPPHQGVVTPEFTSLAAPRPGARGPLRLAFAFPVDWQARDLVAVEAPDHSRLAGRAELVEGERVWRFTPERPWRPGRYAVRLNADLEDPAGDRLAAPFESPAGTTPAAPGADVTHAFEVR